MISAHGTVPSTGSICHSRIFLGVWLDVQSSPAVRGCGRQIFVQRCPRRGLMLSRCDSAVNVVFDCTSLVQSRELDWKDWRGFLACTGTVTSYNILKEAEREWKELVKYFCKNTPKHFLLPLPHTYSSFFFFFRIDRNKLKAILL